MDRDADRESAGARRDAGAVERTAASLDGLVPELYDDLRRLAARHLRAERPDHTLQATALVHEAYVRLTEIPDLEVRGRAELMALAARAMRRILVDYARARNSAKRGGGQLHLALTEGAGNAAPPVVDLIALDVALERLDALDIRQATIIQLRFLAGMTVEETAEALGLSTSTVKRETAFARAWLYRELADDDGVGAR